ncbi:GNAT family N-acetyltransferase, partial [Escherichia coli]
MFPFLETNRLILREIAKNDAEALFAGFSNDEVLQYYGQEAMKTMDEAEAFVDFFAKSYQEKKGIRWGIQRKETEHIIGTIGF